MSFPRYPEYKDSGVEWLGAVPKHWQAMSLRRLAKGVQTGGTPSTESPSPDLDSGFVWYTPGDFGESLCLADSERKVSFEVVEAGEVKQFPSGSVLVVSIGATLGKVGYIRQTSSANQQINAIIPNALVDGYFLAYSLSVKSEAMRFLSNASTIGIMNQERTKDIWLAIPPRIEQSAITLFLDRETAKLDNLMAEQEKLIALLKEKRQAVIAHAVTKGLDPTAPMKGSGVEWIGEIPNHWKVARIKDVARLESGHTPSKTVPEYWEDCDIPWVSLNDSKQLATTDYITETAHQINELGLRNSSARMLPADSVVFTRDATIGLAAIITRPMAVSQHLVAWCPTGLMNSVYLLRVFNAMKEHLDSFTFGATIKTIGMADIKRLATPVPPISEQIEVAAFIGKESAQFDALINDAQHAIDLLKERRTALISAAVTGQIDVRGLVKDEQEQAA